MYGSESLSSQIAAWVEAVGAIAAVVGSGWVAARDSRSTRHREERAEEAALRKEQRANLATRTAALNLAFLATTQIHDLHVLLKNEAWRGRVTRVSASRALLATEHMLTAFPIQSLGDAAAMVEFSRFPGSLVTAAEIYSNLETAVRAAEQNERSTIFDQYNTQMERLDISVERELGALRKALNLVATPPAPN
jgi:hypothetical protein